VSRYKTRGPGWLPSPYLFGRNDPSGVMAMAFALEDGGWEIVWPDDTVELRETRPPEIPGEDEPQIAPGVWLRGAPVDAVKEVALFPERHPRMMVEGWPVRVTAPVPDELDLDDLFDW
jgi:hypothetical protein